MSTPPPSKILLIRHAEKPPEDGTAPFGVTPDGSADPYSLIVRGWTRAGALIAFFAKPTGAIETPRSIFAAAPNLEHGSLHGRRPSETITPLSAFLAIEPNITYHVGGEHDLAAAILNEPGVVLVSWEHHAIRSIVAEFLPGFAQDWPDRFDLVWILTRNAESWSFSEHNQHLLDGDA